ncbi:MAG: extracellular solute-binding protein [Spirochaetaceae bacterium]|nr:extracellular solute-binding protein [Spirochaetaceae bacterium]
MKQIFLLVLAALLIASCANDAKQQGSLDPSGSVRFWTTRPTDALKEIAASLPGLELSEGPKDRPWFHLLNPEAAELDLVFTEMGRDLVKAKADGTIADLSAYWNRMSASKKVWPALATSKDVYFVPSTIYLWGLFYNKEILDSNGIKYPTSFGALESAFTALAAKGVIPIALGSKGDWSVFAWLSYLDIRKNGAEAHQQLLDGKRAFDDPSLTPVYATLQKWRDSGWIDRDSGNKNWSEALMDVQTGKAAFSLMGSFAANRFVEPGKIRWAAVPKGGAKAGEMAVIQGFAASSKATDLEAALALADAFVSQSSPNLASDEFSLPSIVTKYSKEVGKEDVLSTIKAEQAAVLSGAKAIVTQMDRHLPAQTAYNVLQALRDFFDVGSAMSASELAAALKASNQ